MHNKPELGKVIKNTVLSAVLLATAFSYFLPVFLAQAEANPGLLEPGIASGTVNILYLRVTAYSSEADETDDTPFITANGTYVHDGIVATNVLPFGTRVEIPALFGNKVFTVEDRMNAKLNNRMDIWMPSRADALRFGANYADIIVLGGATSTVASETLADAKSL